MILKRERPEIICVENAVPMSTISGSGEGYSSPQVLAEQVRQEADNDRRHLEDIFFGKMEFKKYKFPSP